MKNLEDTLNQVITELRIGNPNTEILTDFDIDSRAVGDHRRIAQLFSNLLGNAITHGEDRSPITVKAKTGSDSFELCVINKGNKIPEETKKHLFKPFSRGKVHFGKEGLGLGLYISSEIAIAHKGMLTVESTDDETCFSLQIPI